MNIVFCSFLGADVYNRIVVFCCVYLYGMWPICLGEDQVEKGVRSGWEALYIFHGHLMPPLLHLRGGMLWTESEKTRTLPEWVSVESKVTGMVIHFEHGGKFPSNSSFLCNLC